MDSLIIENQNLVHSICNKYFKEHLKYHEYDDLFMKGIKGCIKSEGNSAGH
jgi:DNA-directed RNA polymerase specialized sigma subunit